MRRIAFTLIELLVVVAIISLLLAILLPSLRTAKQQAREVKCRTQLREFARGFQYYLSDSHDVFPAADYGPEDDQIRHPTWYELIERYWRGRESDAASDQAAGRALGLGRCPDLGDSVTLAGAPSEWNYDWRTFGYGYNRMFLGYNRFDLATAESTPSFHPKFWRKLREVRDTSQCLLLGDSVIRQLPNYGAIGQAGHYLGWRGLVTLGAGVDTRHGATDDEPTVPSSYRGDTSNYRNGRGNIAWVDGHASARRSQEINDVAECRRFWDPEQNVGGY